MLPLLAALFAIGTASLAPAEARELVFAPAGDLPAAALVDAGAGVAPRLPQAPSGVLSFSPWPPRQKRGLYEVDGLPISLESWSNTLCVKGAWSYRGARPGAESGGLPEVLRHLEVSPAVIAEGLRLGPGIGASTRF